jgi:Asp-tRNA(Asn)/Glu-tRNA(Gln) amidotransferase A subunit family amidase
MKYTAILENSIMQKGLPATANSRLLANFISPIDATVALRLEAAGVTIVGRAETSEFGASGLFSFAPRYEASSSILNDGAILTGKTGDNPCNGDGSLSYVADVGLEAASEMASPIETDPAREHNIKSLQKGHSARGSFQAEKSSRLPHCTETQQNRPLVFDFAGTQENRPPVSDFVFCNDYTGAISLDAALRGQYYIHPTYGTVSRYGLIPSVSSMDQIGIVCKTPEDGFKALKIIKGYDPKDGVMLPEPPRSADSPKLSPTLSFNPTAYSDVYTQIMQILCCAELSNNISRYDGIKFGYRAKEYNNLHELYTKSRTEAFGADVKLAAILGAMVLSHENYMQYYDKAMRIRRLIKESLEFDKYDVIVTKCPLISRLCGLPSLTTPEHTYIANAGCDELLEEILCTK